MWDFIKIIAGPLISGGFMIAVAWWRWRKDGRGQFKAVTADMRAKLDEMRDRRTEFYLPAG